MKSTDIIKASANSLNIYSLTAEALERLIEAVKLEHPCPTCEALARAVMLDQTAHDTRPQAREPLTHHELELIVAEKMKSRIPSHAFKQGFRAAEAAHGIGEKK